MDFYTDEEENDRAAHIEVLEEELRALRERVESLEIALADTIIERNYARILFCDFIADDRRQGYVDHPNCTPSAVAKEYGWDDIIPALDEYELDDADENNNDFRTSDMS